MQTSKKTPFHDEMEKRMIHTCGPFLNITPLLRKLKKAVAVSGVGSGVPGENSGKVPGRLLDNFSQIAKCYKFSDFGHQERQTCRERVTLSPPSVRGLFWNRQFQPSRVFLTNKNSKLPHLRNHYCVIKQTQLNTWKILAIFLKLLRQRGQNTTQQSMRPSLQLIQPLLHQHVLI